MNNLFKQKGTFFIVAFLVLLTTPIYSQLSSKETTPAVHKDSTGYIVKVGDKAPVFTIKLSDGRKITPKDLTGKVVLLQFTASWCGVCRKEMPHLEKDIWQKYKNNPHFVFIGIDRDEPLETVINFAKQTGITYPLGLDPAGKIFSQFAQPKAGITRNVLVDKTGKIVYLTRLFNEEEYNGLVKKVDQILNHK